MNINEERVVYEVEIHNRYTGEWFPVGDEFTDEGESYKFMIEYLFGLDNGASLRVVKATRIVVVIGSN